MKSSEWRDIRFPTTKNEMTQDFTSDLERLGAEKARLLRRVETYEAAICIKATAAVHHGVPIARVAREAGVSRNTVYKWLRGEWRES